LDRVSLQFVKGQPYEWRSGIQSGVSLFWNVVVPEKLDENSERVREPIGEGMFAVGSRYQRTGKGTDD
jgi:hypothetical protein